MKFFCEVFQKNSTYLAPSCVIALVGTKHNVALRDPAPAPRRQSVGGITSRWTWAHISGLTGLCLIILFIMFLSQGPRKGMEVLKEFLETF